MSLGEPLAKRTKLSTPIEEALSALAKVHSFAKGLLTLLAGSPRHVAKANDVFAVFGEYERSLRSLDLPGLSNRQRDLVSAIVKSADNALNVLEKRSCGDASTALDRAYANCAAIEEHLEKLVASLNAGTLSQVAKPGSRATLSAQQSRDGNAEHYRAAHFVPPRPDNVLVDFDSREECGNYSAPEGYLKSALLNSTSSNNVIAASGTATSAIVHGASDMAGVGKTTALIALGHDRHVRDHFNDGVLYMALGADASAMQITDNLVEIMKFTGAAASAAVVRNEADLRKAVQGAALWFQGRCNLFLIDDIWPTSSSSQGYLAVLREILTGSTHSRIMLTTRNRDIVSSTGSYVDFDAQEDNGTPMQTAQSGPVIGSSVQTAGVFATWKKIAVVSQALQLGSGEA